MSSLAIEARQVSAAQRLKPAWRTSKMGYKFDCNDDVWQIDGSTRLNLGRIRNIDERTGEGLRKTLVRYVEELSSDTADNAFTSFNTYCDYTKERNVSVNGLSRWRTSLTDETEYRLGTLKSFLTAWNEWGFPGVDDKVVNYLDELKLKGNVKGKAVSKSCPYSGPFTRLELGAMLNWVTHLGWKLAHVRTQRERIESENTPVGAVLWIAPEHDPSPIKRSLEQRDYKTKPNEDRIVDASTVVALLGASDA